MDNYVINSLFIFDATLKAEKSKPSDEEAQDAKLLFYFPSSEDIMIKRSNMGVIEGSMGLFNSFGKSDNQFILVELNKHTFIANVFEDNKTVVMILEKNEEFCYNSSSTTNKIFMKIFLRYFYDVLVFFHGPLSSLFFPQGEDIKKNVRGFRALTSKIKDFFDSFKMFVQEIKFPFNDNILYFPLNELTHVQLILSNQRLVEKLDSIKYTSLIYKGFILHNEIPMNSISIIYNYMHSNFDSKLKISKFNRPPYKVLQTINSENIEEETEQSVSDYRRCFELVSASCYITGIQKLNINNYHVFIPKVYFAETNEYLNMLIYYHKGLVLFLFLEENFNPREKVSNLIKLEKWVKKYYKEEVELLEKLYLQKQSKVDIHNYAYISNANKSIKLSSLLFAKKNKTSEKERMGHFLEVIKLNFEKERETLTKIKGFYVYWIQTLDRKILILLPESLNISVVKDTLEDIKKDIFDFIFIL